MARIVNEQEHAAKRNEILDVVQRLVYARGYQGMKIQDILDDLRISKGAFYHYFDSKEAVIAALSDRMIDETERRLALVVNDPDLTALEKFERFFVDMGGLKTEQKPLFVALLRGWFHDDNALTRDKVRLASKKRLAPLLTTIIRQGIEEGVLATAYPDQVAEVLLTLMQGLADSAGRLALTFEAGDDLAPLERIRTVYTDTCERLVGAPSGSLRLNEVSVLLGWIESMKGSAS